MLRNSPKRKAAGKLIAAEFEPETGVLFMQAKLNKRGRERIVTNGSILVVDIQIKLK